MTLLGKTSRMFFALAALGALLAAGQVARAEEGKTYELPFTVPGANPLSPLKQMHVKLTVGKAGERNFLFDTGASFPIVLGQDLADELGVENLMDIEVQGVGSAQSQLTIVDFVEVAGYRESDVPAAVLDLSGITAQMAMLGISFDGIIGISFFTAFKSLEMDYRKNVVRFSEYAKGDTRDEEAIADREKTRRALKNRAAGKGAFLGVAGLPAEEADLEGLDIKNGLKVQQVVPGSAAEKAGIQEGDIIFQVDDEKIGTPTGLMLEMSAHVGGDRVTLHLVRDGKKITKDAVLSDKPADAAQAQGTPKPAETAKTPETPKPADAKLWTCPMHPEVQSQKPGKCPKCGMNLVPAKPAAPKPQTPKPPQPKPQDGSEDF